VLSRNQKRVIFFRLKESKIIENIFADFDHPETLLDMQSVFVPLVMFGSCKEGSVPYNLWCAYKVKIRSNTVMTPEIIEDPHFIDPVSHNHFNISREMSTNWPGPITQQFVPTTHEKFIGLEDELAVKGKGSEVIIKKMIDDMSILTINDPDAAHIKIVLDMLNKKRYMDRNLRFQVVYALVNTNPSYIPLARWFYQKRGAGYSDAKFDKVLENALGGKRYEITIRSIYFWASLDNPDKYEIINERSTFMRMSQYVFDPIGEGRLQHAHFAELMYLFMSAKYRSEPNPNNPKETLWYEFKFPQDKHMPGELYKWAKIDYPISLDIYLHRKLHNLSLRMVAFLKDKLTKETCKELHEWYKSVLKNFKNSAINLWSSPFKRHITEQCSKMFYTPGFVDKLDKSSMAMGVGNGVLLLSDKGDMPVLINGYNSHNVSRFTTTMYRPFDPKDPLTRKILKGLRSQQMDHETDAFEYITTAMAASLDGRPREALLFLIFGHHLVIITAHLCR
jgi:hypothetical protein